MVELTYLGTATTVLRLGGRTLLTDPAFDPPGTSYDFGVWCTPRSWFGSEKLYRTPELVPASLDGVLISHDHHADNLDLAGRRIVAGQNRIVTTVPGARRLARPASAQDAPGKGLGLGERALGLAPGGQTRIGEVTVTATLARHGPWYGPQVNQVTGFLLDVPAGPRVWISGDTVLFPALSRALAAIGAERPVDVAVVHCGAVAFPRVPAFNRARFTFDAAEAIEACRLVRATTIVPVHRSGWAHFRQPEAILRAEFERAGLGGRTRFLELGETAALSPPGAGPGR
jgi:L-ascorbate metabolism protein UlaG (beta-lactamase superfamily)